MPSVTVRIPDSLRVSGYIPDPINTHAKARLTAILARETSNASIELGPSPLREVSTHANFWLNAVDAARLAEVGTDRQMSVGEVITALLVEDARRTLTSTLQASAAPNKLECADELLDALRALGLKEREEQSRFYRAVTKVAAPDTAPANKVLFAEAGTGTGKTLAYLVAARRFAAQQPGSRVGIAVPTHALMDKVLQDWAKLNDTAQGSGAATVALLGQAEFVSVKALQEILDGVEDEEVCAKVRSWIARGGQGPNDGVVQQRWTAAGLRSAVPEFTLHGSVTLEHRADDDDPGYLSYRSQWASMPMASVVIMTHAMLASLTWRRVLAETRARKTAPSVKAAIAEWSSVAREEREARLYEILDALYAEADDGVGQELIPNLDLLIVDEAHQLDDAFALVLTRTASLWALRRDVQSLHAVQPKAVLKSDLDALDAIWYQLRGMGDADGVLVGDECARVAETLADVLGTMSDRKRARNVEPARWRRIASLAYSLRAAMKAKTGTSFMEVMVRWSPDRMWPQLTIGRLSYAREMHFLWTVIAKRTCLVSGTLYEEMPQLSCESARRALNVPFDNVLTMEPVHAAWQQTPVVACVIGAFSTAGGRPRFVRPRVKGEDVEVPSTSTITHADWVHDVAGYLAQAHREGAGGMLALGTAFRDLQAISTLLRDLTSAPVLEHRPGYSLATLREQFIALAESGQRPILLAAGSAWTGFDLHSEAAANACTDLAIINAPFGAISQTLARTVRIYQKRGFPELASQVTVLVRQGIGRLVRSPSTPNNRRIHWLDARIHQPSAAGLLNPIKRLFSKYRQITVG